MNYRNYTIDELIRMAEHEENELAAYLGKRMLKEIQNLEQELKYLEEGY